MNLTLSCLSWRRGRAMRLAVGIGLGMLAPALAVPPVLAGEAFAPVMLVAQNDRDAAQLTLRIQALESQVRDLTGQVQGLQFQLTQLQTLLDRSNQDTDFRFKQLEGGQGGAPGKNDAAGQSGSVRPSEIAPQNPGTATQLAAAPTMAASTGGDGLGPSMDPLVGKGSAGERRSAEEVPLGPATAAPARMTAPLQPAPMQRTTQAPVTLASTGTAAADPQAEAQYKAGYDAIVKGNYAVAADQFKGFIKQYPNDPQAADATNWLGEALLQQQDYVDAADVLVTGYKTYPDSPRAPDMLLKLGIALAGAKQPDAACKTFGLLSQKYPNTTTAFKTRLKQEMARGKCPA